MNALGVVATVLTILVSILAILKALFHCGNLFFGKQLEKLNQLNILSMEVSKNENDYIRESIQGKINLLTSRLFYYETGVIADTKRKVKQLGKLIKFLRPFEIKKIAGLKGLDLRDKKIIIKSYMGVEKENHKMRKSMIEFIFLSITYLILGLFFLLETDNLILGLVLLGFGYIFEIYALVVKKQFFSKKEYINLLNKVEGVEGIHIQ
ncbi:hypothetical protein [Francisella frigiditurris]|uniref:Uncharacterized protein n=1 Tax=Francisella frigiditurris TaxID=1542390 RepID=A0A1J0KVB6_9GAMM|nr:hypothetical protein [Francisella frigiditurris]APC97760.1 hypothetical protein KX01_996 [Francisella frigiditurris]